MPDASVMARETITLAGIELELHEGGEGPPLLFLHGASGFTPDPPYVGLLAQRRRLIAPSHPGFGASGLPLWLDTVDDIAHLYLELMDRRGLGRVDVVGTSLGGWLAAEIATKVPERIGKLALVGPVGVKLGPADKLDIPDIFAMAQDKVVRLIYHDVDKGKLDYSKMTDEQLTVIARNRETTALLTWEPWMHNPKLRHRLHRIASPTLFIRGASDGLVSADYVDGYAKLIPGCASDDDRGGGTRPATGAAGRIRARAARLPGRRSTSGRDAMRAWHFSETAYPYLPPVEEYESIRVSLPNRIYDPKKGAALYDRYIEEWQIAEEEGVEIMLNEHHQTATCVDPAAPLLLAALARVTKKARLLILGNPIANRRQPVRVAEEMALVDMLSHGRLEAGFVRGVPYEISAGNSNPVRTNERFAEALDLIIKAWTSHDGPFSHEGRFFHHRQINIWPRPFQSPHPPVWISTTTPAGSQRVGAQGFVQATFLTGYDGTRRVYDAYRRGWREAGRGEAVPIDRLAYAALVYVGDNEADARAGAEKILWYIRANKVPPHFAFPPGYAPPAAFAHVMRGDTGDQHRNFSAQATVESTINAGLMMAGTPDQVYAQVRKMYDHVGGFGHLLIMGQAGFLEHDETVRSIRNFARHVYPRLKAEMPDSTVSGFSMAPAAAAS